MSLTDLNYKQVNGEDPNVECSIAALNALNEEIEKLKKKYSELDSQYEKYIIEHGLYWKIEEFAELANGRDYETISLIIQDKETGKLDTQWTYDDSTRIEVHDGLVEIRDGYFGDPWPKYGDKVIGFFNVKWKERED